MKLRLCAAAFMAAALAASSSLADDGQPATDQAQIARAKALLASLHPQHGDVAVPAAHATLHLGERYYFLGPDDARKVLIDGWGNPPDATQGVLGMVFPAGRSPLGDTWGAVVTYLDEGYVPDADARTTNYNDLLQRMRKAQEDDDADRVKRNEPQIHLVGWAQPPSYDGARHALIWARDLKFDDAKRDTLNYDIRELGRHGVLSLNMVSTMDMLPQVRAAAGDLGAAAGFEPGQRYEDYQKGVDKRAAYGVAGLIAAGAGLALAQKAGLVALVFLFLKKGAVVLVAGFAALANRFKGLFRRRDKTLQAPRPGEWPDRRPPGGP